MNEVSNKMSYHCAKTTIIMITVVLMILMVPSLMMIRYRYWSLVLLSWLIHNIIKWFCDGNSRDPFVDYYLRYVATEAEYLNIVYRKMSLSVHGNGLIMTPAWWKVHRIYTSTRCWLMATLSVIRSYCPVG